MRLTDFYTLWSRKKVIFVEFTLKLAISKYNFEIRILLHVVSIRCYHKARDTMDALKASLVCKYFEEFVFIHQDHPIIHKILFFARACLRSNVVLKDNNATVFVVILAEIPGNISNIGTHTCGVDVS